MKEIDRSELKEIIQSGHINLLIGSGCSLPYISTLKSIEDRMNDEATKLGAQKEYYTLVRKAKYIIDTRYEMSEKECVKLTKSRSFYDDFVSFWANIISKRSLHIVNKQINIFTTNFDVFLEDSCERLSVPYNDGFSGQLNPSFNVSNFNRIQRYKSLQFDNTSDIPLFNIIKLHGSLSWQTLDDKIIYSNGSHIPNELDSEKDDVFLREYDKRLALINPHAEKHFETVLDINYASMLRKFALELEKENSVLFIIGSSLSDKHIRHLLYNAMRSNPTLVVVYFSASKYDTQADDKNEKQNKNLYIITEYTFEKFTNYMESVFPRYEHKYDEETEQDEE